MAIWARVFAGLGSLILGSLGAGDILAFVLWLVAPWRIDDPKAPLLKKASGVISPHRVASHLVWGCWLLVLAVWLGRMAWG